MILAEITFGHLLLTVLEVFLFIAWFWILISIFGDLFRDHTLSGWAKAAWTLVLLFLPFLGVLVYLIARGEGMRERAVKEQADARKQFEDYVRESAGKLTGRRASQAQRLEAKRGHLRSGVRAGEGEASGRLEAIARSPSCETVPDVPVAASVNR